MQYFKVFLIAFFILYMLIFLYLCKRSKRFFASVILNGFLGIAFVIIIKLTSKYSGVFIPVNQYTVLLSSGFGLPGVIAFLLSNIIFL